VERPKRRNDISIRQSQRLREVRKSAKVSQKRLAQAAGLHSHSIISDYENGKVRIPSNHLVAFSRALGCSTKQIADKAPGSPLPQRRAPRHQLRS
jgi:transcriptional regulator with XRE-family HTH domain